MKKEVVMSFDLSTTCTGVAVATTKNRVVQQLCTLAIQPEGINPVDLGFLPRRVKIFPKKGRAFNAYIRHTGEIISKTEKERRDSLVRKASEETRLHTTSKEISRYFKEFQPSVILMEANMSFRSMEVTRKLAEVAGALQALAAANDIPIHKINVHTARARYDIYGAMEKLARTLTPEQKKRVDMTKETVKFILFNKYIGYGLNTHMTTDESDALLLLDYWLNYAH
jgi:hypothetical protein